MDQWQDILDLFGSTNPDIKGMVKILQTAGVLFKEDLAHFELEWMLKTLLFKPINILNIIKTKREEDAWCKPIGDCFKLLTFALNKYGDDLSSYYEQIVQVCNLKYEPGTKKHALDCLACMAKWTSQVSQDIQRYISALGEATICKTPLALFIGSVCEHQPRTVEDEVTTIWRIYLNLLESNRNSDTVLASILQGVLGLFKNFGEKLPTAELNDFYRKISDLYPKTTKCDSVLNSPTTTLPVILSMLEKHASLFRESITDDLGLRNRLWDTLTDSAGAHALLSVYTAVFVVKKQDKPAIHVILKSEIIPRVRTRSLATYTALRVRTHALRTYDVYERADREPTVENLEFELRCGAVSKDVADTILWSMECELSNSDKLLQTSIIFYKHIPASKVKEIIIHRILKVPPQVRKAAIILLTTETCQDSISLDNYLPLWKMFYESSDYEILYSFALILEDLLEYTRLQLKTALEDDLEVMPDRLAVLLRLCSRVSTLEYSDATEAVGEDVLHLTVQCMRKWGLCASTAACAASLRYYCRHHGDREVFLNMLTIDGCRDEALLCEICLVLLDTDEKSRYDDVIKACQILISRNDVEPSTLSKVLHKLDALIASEKFKNKEVELSSVLDQVKKLRSKKMIGKEGRILQRDILFFLGKYSGLDETTRESFSDSLVVQLKGSLTLSLLNPDDGVYYKVNLGRILQMAIQDQNSIVLQVLLTVTSAALANRKEASLQRAVSLICRALCRAHAHTEVVDIAAIHHALLQCDDMNAFADIISYIKEEMSPGARRMLSDALESVMVARTGSDVTEHLISTVGEQVLLMMDSTDSLTRKAGLYLTESLAAVMRNNTGLMTTLVPKILYQITKMHYDQDLESAFKSISDVFLDKMELYRDEEIKEIVAKFLEHITTRKREDSDTNSDSNDDSNSARNYKTGVEKYLVFIKNIYAIKNWQNKALLKIKPGLYRVEWLYVLADMKKVFEFNDDIMGDVLRDCNIIEELNKVDLANDSFAWETVIKVMTEFATVLLKNNREETLLYLATLTSKLTPRLITEISNGLPICYKKYRELNKGIPSVDLSFRNWWNGLKFGDVKDILTFRSTYINPQARDMILSMKLMLQSFTKESLNAEQVLTWPHLVLKLVKSNETYENAFIIGLHFFTVGEVVQLLESHGDIPNVYKNACFDRLCEESSLQSLGRCGLLNDVVKWCLVKNNTVHCDAVLELVEKLWSEYETHATMDQKISLLDDMRRLPKSLDATSAPMRWAIARVVEGGASEMIRLVGAFPPGPGFSEVYKKFSWLLPAQLSEVSGETGAVLRALLDAVADGDSALLDILASLCMDCETKGWWDEAIESCTASLALKADRALCEVLYKRAWRDASTGVCERLLVPFLRYSTSSFCEEFLSGVLKDLLQVLRVQPTPANHYEYSKRVGDYARALMIIQVAFEKVPQSLESPNTPLYRSLGVEQTWYLVRETCRLCVTLQKNVKCPVETDKWKKFVRKFHQVAYSCLCSAICCRRPAANFYNLIFNVDVWSSVVDEEYEYNIPLRASTAVRKVRRAVGVEVSDRSSSATRTGGTTVRTKVFLRTLTENPLHYDLIPLELQTVVTQDVELLDNELNAHPCAPTLTALLEHAVALDHRAWLQTLATTLAKPAHRNVKWLLAQAICNRKDVLSPHAAVLRGPLFQLVADTAKVDGNRKLLNGLHIDILETLSSWRDDTTLDDPSYLNSTIDCMISTIIDNSRNPKTNEILMHCFNDILLVYGNRVTLTWNSFQQYFNDKPTEETKSCINIVSKMSKHGVFIPEIFLTTLTEKLESSEWFQAGKSLGLLGKVAALLGRPGGSRLEKYRAVLNKLRRQDPAEYVRMLYYAQMEGQECCDVNNFKRIMDLVWKVPRAERSKCLRILSSYVSRHAAADGAVSAMFDVVDLPELIDGDHAEEAMELVKSGLGVMREDLKRRLVKQITGHTQHSLVKVRKAAIEVVLAVFKELYPTDSEARKRRKRDSTPIIDSASKRDEYIDVVMTSLALGITRYGSDDKDGVVGKDLEQLLNTDDMAIRFVECFILTAYLPSVRGSSSTELDLCTSLSVLMEMLFVRMRSRAIFQKMKLRDGPLAIRDTNTEPPKLLTMSKTYQGTVRSYWNRQQRQKGGNSDLKSSGIDVQIPVDTVLQAILKFTKVNTEASISFCVEVVKSIRSNNKSGFDFDSIMSKLLAEMVARIDGLTPLVVELCRVFIDTLCRVNGFRESLEGLIKPTRGSEGEGMVKLLLEEVKLRTGGYEYFTLGTPRMEDIDAIMAEGSRHFTMDDLIATFGKLSNWDDMTLQERARLEPTLPKLWTCKRKFKKILTKYKPVNNSWLDMAVSCSRREDSGQNYKMLKDLQKWPANHFAISAVIEQMEFFKSSKDISEDDEYQLNFAPFDMRPSDCMAEWAARLMIRQTNLRLEGGDTLCDDDYEENGEMIGPHELRWCIAANYRQLPRLALDCCRWNESFMRECDVYDVAWKTQKMRAKRTLALRKNDLDELSKLREEATILSWEDHDLCPHDILLIMNELIHLSADIKDLRISTLMNTYMNDVSESLIFKDCSVVTAEDLRTLDSMHYAVMSFYWDQWEGRDSIDRNRIVLGMAEVLKQSALLNPTKSEALVSTVLDCIDGWSDLSEEAAKSVLTSLFSGDVPRHSLEDIRNNLGAFPPASVQDFPLLMSDSESATADKYRMCFQLVADANHSLHGYCEKLHEALNDNDKEQWRRTFDIMKKRIFENPYAGDDYRVLYKHTNSLYNIYNYDETSKDEKRRTLREVLLAVNQEPRSELRLSQLCPELVRGDLQAETSLGKLLGLPDWLTVVRFYDQVKVMTGSIRRPCVLEARLSDGRKLRLMHKSGDRLRTDASAQRACRLLADYCPQGTLFTHYEVTVLGEDCGLIEFLEEHDTLRNVISDSCDLKVAVPGPEDSELILQPSGSALQRHRDLCDKVPATALRCSIEKRSSCVQDYILKKRRFQDSLAFMTVVTWLLGLGDRHLNNLMYSVREGSVCCVDWSAIFQHGNPREPPPARLTRNLRAVCDADVFESRVQMIMTSLRASHKILVPALKIIFKWMGGDFNEKLKYIRGILEGKMLPHEITRDVLSKSNEKYKERYQQLLDNVFSRYESKEIYSVEEQVSNLLEHCTDERILAVTRADWEPWV